MDLEQNQEHVLAQMLLALRERLRTILVSSDFIFTELYNGLGLLLWGLWIAIPYWDTFYTSSVYANLSRIPIPENIQGIIVMCVGLAVMYGVFFGSTRVRKLTTFWAACIWMFLSAMFILANFKSTATITYPMLSASAIWAYWRVAVRYEE
jgi:hypothetical protein